MTRDSCLLHFPHLFTSPGMYIDETCWSHVIARVRIWVLIQRTGTAVVSVRPKQPNDCCPRCRLVRSWSMFVLIALPAARIFGTTISGKCLASSPCQLVLDKISSSLALTEST